MRFLSTLKITPGPLTKNIVRSLFSFKKEYDLGVCNNLITELGNVSEENPVPDHIPKPAYYFEKNKPSLIKLDPEIKTSADISGMQESCKLAANLLKKCTDIVQIGITTDEIDKFVHNEIIKLNAYPSPLRYMGFPKSVCTSVNNIACHGIPDDRPLMDGDIINVDITLFYNGYHGDCSKTFLVGNVDERGRYLVAATEECLYKAIDCCANGQPYNKIGKTISKYVKQKGLTVMPAFLGHGIGSFFHGQPDIYHFDNKFPGIMETGVTFTIEPVLTLGTQDVELWDDLWTASSVDNARSAQFEHTILITDTGAEILTIPD